MLLFWIWLISAVIILVDYPTNDEDFEAHLIDSAWQSFMPLKRFKILLAIFLVIIAPLWVIWGAFDYVKDYFHKD